MQKNIFVIIWVIFFCNSKSISQNILTNSFFVTKNNEMRYLKDIKYNLEFLQKGEEDGILFKNTYNEETDIETKDYLKNIIVKMLEVTKSRVVFENLVTNPIIYLKIYGLRKEDMNGISVLEEEFFFKVQKKKIEKEVWVLSNESSLPESSLEDGFHWNVNGDFVEGFGVDYELLSRYIEELFGVLCISNESEDKFDIIIPYDTNFSNLKSYLSKKYGIIFTKSIEPINCFFISENYEKY